MNGNIAPNTSSESPDLGSRQSPVTQLPESQFRNGARMIDFILLGICAVVVWLVASDGAWNAAITFVSSLIGGLIAMNYFEPLANFLQTTVASSFEWQHRVDIIALLGLFAFSIFALKTLGEALLPTYAELHGYVYDAARWGCAGLTGLVVTGVVCTSLHVAPLPREFLGFTPERANMIGLAPDRMWLGFVQYASEKSLARVAPDGRKAIFDGATAPINPADPNKGQQVWASFPIKYATRRQQYAAGAIAAAPATAAPPPTSGGASRNTNPNAGTGGF